jgi:TonB family protein
LNGTTIAQTAVFANYIIANDFVNLAVLSSIFGLIVVASPNFANAKPSEVPRRATPTGGYIDDNDYPSQFYSQGIGGNVVMRWDTDPTGRVRRCKIVRSSGWPVLDAYTCKLLTARWEYDPARDETGAKIWDSRMQHIGWRPSGSSGPKLSKPEYFDYSLSVKGLPGATRSVLVSVAVLTDETGKPKSCKVVEPGKIAAVDKIACSALISGGPLPPLLDDAGKAQTAMQTVILRFTQDSAAPTK